MIPGRVQYFKIEGGFGFKTKEEAEAWAFKKANPRQQVHITLSRVTNDWPQRFTHDAG
jgi:cold shock CspA family protein